VSSIILNISNVAKKYGQIQALNNVSFEVPQGSIYGILGPNGSGKTTLLGIVMDVLKATNGTYSWFGQPGSAATRQQIGTLLETPNFYHYLSGIKNLEIAAKIKGRNNPNLDEVLKTVNLYERRNSKFNTYSLGMKQRLAIAAALIGNPEVLVLDEPTNGLDPAGIAEIRILIRELASKGKTIIMASHILDEVEKVCTHVAIIQKGVLKKAGSVAHIMGSNTTATTNIFIATQTTQNLQTVLATLNGFISIAPLNNGFLLTVQSHVTTTNVNSFCFNNGITLSALNAQNETLENKFLEITEKQAG
jgi:ABC-type multidrug transport system ATPase subunit